jgi:hypothetical protein
MKGKGVLRYAQRLGDRAGVKAACAGHDQGAKNLQAHWLRQGAQRFNNNLFIHISRIIDMYKKRKSGYFAKSNKLVGASIVWPTVQPPVATPA